MAVKGSCVKTVKSDKVVGGTCKSGDKVKGRKVSGKVSEVVGGKSEMSGADVRTDDSQIPVIYGRKLPEGAVVDGILRLRGEGIPLRMICGR